MNTTADKIAGFAAKENETARLFKSQCKLRKRKMIYFFLHTALNKKDISFCQTADCGLSTKGWPHAHISANHIKWHTHALTHSHKHSLQIKSKTGHAERKSDLPIGQSSHAEKDLNITGNEASVTASLPVQQSYSDASGGHVIQYLRSFA